MKFTFLLIFTILFLNSSFGQTEDEILTEAYLLYNSEKASWNGTDIFLEQFPEKRERIGGYVSYSENNMHSCVFFDQDENPNLLAKITFNDNFDLQLAEIDTIRRKLSKVEMDLYTIRKIAHIEMEQDTIFKRYDNTNLNPIPIITNKSRKVFVLTGPRVSGVVVLGNDYLLTFSKKNKLKSKILIHKNIIPIEYGDETMDAVTMHSHLKSTGNLITSTDICTIMLYERYAHWKQHIVISENNVSIWDCEKNELLIMTRKAWDKTTNQ